MTEPDKWMFDGVWDVLDRTEQATRAMMSAYDWHMVYKAVVLPVGFDQITGVVWEDIFKEINGD